MPAVCMRDHSVTGVQLTTVSIRINTSSEPLKKWMGRFVHGENMKEGQQIMIVSILDCIDTLYVNYYYYACHPTLCSISFNIDHPKHP